MATSRPGGLDDERYAAFVRLQMLSLSDQQQRQVISRVLGPARNEAAVALTRYVETTLPTDETGSRITGAPAQTRVHSVDVHRSMRWRMRRLSTGEAESHDCHVIAACVLCDCHVIALAPVANA